MDKGLLNEWEKILVGMGLGMGVGTYNRKLIYQHRLDYPPDKASSFNYTPEGNLFNTKRGPANSFYGKQHTEATKQKNREAHLGKPSGFKDKKHTEEAKRKNSEAHKGKIPWIAGKHHSEEAKAKIKAARAMQVLPVTPVTCGHPDRRHKSAGMCNACYRRKRYKEQHTTH